MRSGFNSHGAAVAGLVCLMVAVPWWLHANNPALGLVWAIVAGALVPALLIYATLRQTRNWSGITALCMIPLACIGIMEIVATAGAPDSGMTIAVISVLTFFAALDAGRRSQ